MKILVVGGHPADVFDHCGGTLLHHTRAGDVVTCLALTHGIRVHDEVVSEVFRFGMEGYTAQEIEHICAEREQVKLDEVKEACALFGVTDVRSLRYDDKMLMVTPELIDAVAKVIREVKPDLLITHYPLSGGNTFNHHGNTAKIAIAATGLAGTVDFDDPNPSWRIAETAFMLNCSDMMAFNALSGYNAAVANYFVDVTDAAELKVKAMDVMRSQQYQGWYSRKFVECDNGLAGVYNRIPYCEAFMMSKPVISDLIRVSEHWLTRANEPEKVSMDRDFTITAAFVPMPGS